MPRTIFPYTTQDVSALARSLDRELEAVDRKLGHVRMLNVLARSAGYQNFQHFRAQFATRDRLHGPSAPPDPVDYLRVERVARHFDKLGCLIRWPAKASHRSLCLWSLWARLPSGQTQSEPQINQILNANHLFGDHALLRRALCDHGLLSRTADGREYRRIERRPAPEAITLIRHLGLRGPDQLIADLAFERNMPFSPTSGTAAHSDAPAPLILQTSGGPVETFQFGGGPALLALHGGMGGYDQSLLLVRAALGDEPAARVIAVSRPGYLGTPLGSGATPEQQADLYAGLLDRLGVSASFVIAVSAGGPSALQFAKRHPSRCAGLILVSCCTGQLQVPPEVASRMPLMKLIARLPWLIGIMRWRAERNPLKAARRSIRDPALAARTLADPIAGPLLRELQSSTLRRLSERLPGTLNDIDQFSSISPISAARIGIPMLVIHGNADRVVPFAHGQRVGASAPNAELVAIDGGGHVSLFTHLDPIRTKVRAFIAQAQAPYDA